MANKLIKGDIVVVRKVLIVVHNASKDLQRHNNVENGGTVELWHNLATCRRRKNDAGLEETSIRNEYI